MCRKTESGKELSPDEIEFLKLLRAHPELRPKVLEILTSGKNLTKT